MKFPISLTWQSTGEKRGSKYKLTVPFQEEMVLMFEEENITEKLDELDEAIKSTSRDKRSTAWWVKLLLSKNCDMVLINIQY